MNTRKVVGFLSSVTFAGGLMIALPSAAATIWYVGGAGADDGNAGTSSEPFATIQKGVDAASNFDTVLIADGTYQLTDAIDLKGKHLELRGASGDRARVVVDAQGACPCLLDTNQAQLIISSMTFANGYSSGIGDSIAGGITLTDRSLITNCVVRDCCHAEVGSDAIGGGLCLSNTLWSAISTMDKWPVGKRFMPTVADTLVVGCSVSARDTVVRTVRGGGIYARFFNSQNVTVQECVLTNDTPVLAHKYAQGGGMRLLCGSHTGCIIRKNKIVNQKEPSNTSYLCAGGGVCIEGSSTKLGTLKDCLIEENEDKGCGAGVAVGESGLISGCTIRQNAIPDAPESTLYQLGGAGVYVFGRSAVLENCLIAENTMTCEFDKLGYSGAVTVVDSLDVTIRDCVIRDNDVKNAGALSCYNSGGILVTNCVMVGNKASKEVSAIRYWTSQTTEASTSAGLITDCFIMSNSNIRTTTLTSGGGVINYWGAVMNYDQYYIAPLVVRNCLFAGNRAANGSNGWVVRASAGDKAHYVGADPFLTFDHCTFVTNINESAYGKYVDFSNALAASNTTFKGCVFMGNRYTQNSKTSLAWISESYPYAKFKNCYSDYVNDAFTVTEENGNLTGTGVNFVNLENFDFRIRKDSILIDKGGPFEDWMGTGKRKSTQDMGSGYAIGSVGTYGVTVGRVQSNPRRYGVASDVGCCEYWMAPGIMMLVR